MIMIRAIVKINDIDKHSNEKNGMVKWDGFFAISAGMAGYIIWEIEEL
jgi:hypothetical protein